METYRGIRLDPDYLIFDNTSSRQLEHASNDSGGVIR